MLLSSLSPRLQASSSRLAVVLRHHPQPKYPPAAMASHYSSPTSRDQSPSPLTGIPLRLMPLGGSITQGVGSSDSNGYRKHLFDLLQSSGCNIDMVGSRKTGSMASNSHEGWRGFRLDEIERKARRSVPVLQPDLFTVNAGSNDCLQRFEIDVFGERMGALLAYLWLVAPRSTVILSTLVINADGGTDEVVRRVNEQIREVVTREAAAGKRIVLADMYSKDGPGLEDLGADGTHPDDVGYEKMARIWFDSIHRAAVSGFFISHHQTSNQ
ncbi:SGNH/GDSL hydrolase family protein [Aspergillus lucknowensis]|uniref:SGNH hydrolase-type esterase domain-containing protein n=1 Tax=Aspergillus lucknowensis TaxID=176173 RepID=A0ABR4LSY1_9EURO